MQVEVTDADRAAAAHYNRVFPDIRLSEAFARHREAARLEGIRLGLEAAAGVCDEHGVTWGLSYRSMTDNIATAIRAIDPAVIGAGQLPQRADSGR